MHSSAKPLRDAVVVISDFVQDRSDFPAQSGAAFDSDTAGDVRVEGGYLERLPLALVRSGRAGFAEIWHHHRGDRITARRESPALTRRAFPGSSGPPFHSDAMVEFIHRHGAPRILCVLGLGVSEAVLEACASSFILYNSIDVPALRVPADVSRHFDLVITGAAWQSADVRERHRHMPTLVLPIGPDFASPETFFPIPGPKPYDLIYVAAAQPYKRHDLLFAALQRSPRPLRALCVMGYGEDGERLRQEAGRLGLAVDFVGPPGVSHAEVNRLMNTAKIGVVCGENDGAPAILTEYMLAGLPVVANARLRCGLDYIRPETGIAAPADGFELAMIEALARADFTPRQTVLDHWAWPHSVRHLGTVIDSLQSARTLDARHPARMETSA